MNTHVFAELLLPILRETGDLGEVMRYFIYYIALSRGASTIGNKSWAVAMHQSEPVGWPPEGRRDCVGSLFWSHG
jgi:hypothetical protein